jgi:hypothetical protein
MTILQQVADRLWVPHQAALEYQRNRLEVISKQRAAYHEIESLLTDTLSRLKTSLRSYTRHPLIDVQELLKSVEVVIDKQVSEIREVCKKHPDWLVQDPLQGELTTLLEGRVGPEYAAEQLVKIFRDGDERYRKSVPPGFQDAKSKPSDSKYGDLVLWMQLIDKGNSGKRAMVLITDDAKDDWWWKHEGKTIGPRPELVAEMKYRAGVEFYMYPSDRFMLYARQFLNSQVTKQTIEEVREVRESDEIHVREWQRFLANRDEKRHEMEKARSEILREIARCQSEQELLQRRIKQARVDASPEGSDRIEHLTMQREEALSREIRLSDKLAEISDRIQDIAGFTTRDLRQYMVEMGPEVAQKLEWFLEDRHSRRK